LIYPNPDTARTLHYQWYYENDSIPGAVEQFYYPQDGLNEGEYRIYVFEFVESCGDFTKPYKKPVPSTRSASGEWFSIYPNPSGGHFTVSFNPEMVENETTATITLFSPSGNKIKEQKVNCTNEVEFNENLNNGTYLLKVETNNNLMETKQIIVKK
jgi:hypothetical protein